MHDHDRGHRISPRVIPHRIRRFEGPAKSADFPYPPRVSADPGTDPAKIEPGRHDLVGKIKA
ncbi:hypothetical protein [Amycolatopsis sp. PS_44_ISF1]|uniref:hypothetical protein n=1 Tax=Amycolatopsis sp. PS_44_ISF1 TaxID=2974917 RepID=UPI0028DF9BD0|nr:hypothetical protein [Amycolatopsis sp. PS_44_ISF1]MDT8909531.1 hypothetical protein [Amycolatopsis sp. PS_44_ISF1]